MHSWSRRSLGPAILLLALGIAAPLAAQPAPTPPTSDDCLACHQDPEFRRGDGRKTPGVDVPYPFDGGMSFTAIGGVSSGNFVLVRAQAKLEPPLLNLRGLGGAVIISTIADVTFYGHDQTGIPVSVTGQISVNFADWVDPEG